MRIVPPEERRKNGEWCCVCEKQCKDTIRLRDLDEYSSIDICYQCLGEATRLIVPSL